VVEPVAAGSEKELIDVVGRISMLLNPPRTEAVPVSGKEVAGEESPVPVIPLSGEDPAVPE
jgi:hypothetical protein